jgi:hypothetical protein
MYQTRAGLAGCGLAAGAVVGSTVTLMRRCSYSTKLLSTTAEDEACQNSAT